MPRGDKDAFASAAETDSLAVTVSAERTKIYTNTGHAVHWERPNAFAKDVLAFIQVALDAKPSA